MKTLASVFVTLFLTLSICCAVTAQQPAVVLGDALTVSGTIVAIDKADREITMQGPRGDLVVVDIDPAVTNFNQLEVGDQVNMTYYQAVALAIGPKGQLPTVSTSTTIGRGPSGSKPGGYAVETTDIVATVRSIDRKNRTVALQGPGGNLFMVKVPPDMQRFDQLKVGDTVHARYTEAVAISVQKP